MNDIQRFGAFVACIEAGVSPAFGPQAEGAFAKLSSEEAAPLGRLLLRGAHAAMRVSGDGATAPAFHLKLACQDPVWTVHSQDLADHVSEVIQVLEPMEKRAFGDVLGGLGAGTRALGYGAVGAGAGLGGLLWLLNRHSTEEDAKQESTKRQINYYHTLSKELQESMKRKYGYEPSGDGNDRAEGITTGAQ